MRCAALWWSLALSLVAAPALAQGDAPLTTPVIPQAETGAKHGVPVDTTPPGSAARQPEVPSVVNGTAQQPNSPVVDQIVRRPRPSLVVRKTVVRAAAHKRRLARYRGRATAALDRPALAGVELLAPLPEPGEPPHVLVPTPAYPLESLAADFTTPPPPIVCRPVRRDPEAPDPHLYREVPVECVPDNP